MLCIAISMHQSRNCFILLKIYLKWEYSVRLITAHLQFLVAYQQLNSPVDPNLPKNQDDKKNIIIQFQ